MDQIGGCGMSALTVSDLSSGPLNLPSAPLSLSLPSTSPHSPTLRPQNVSSSQSYGSVTDIMMLNGVSHRQAMEAQSMRRISGASSGNNSPGSNSSSSAPCNNDGYRRDDRSCSISSVSGLRDFSEYGAISPGQDGSYLNDDDDPESALHRDKRRAKPKDRQVSYVCGVCSDKALGYNFDAITCESCKAFFRRNATKKKDLVCSFEGNCTIDIHSRKFCPACRLKKCFGIGMRKEWILSEDQLEKRRLKRQMRTVGHGGSQHGSGSHNCGNLMQSFKQDHTSSSSLDSSGILPFMCGPSNSASLHQMHSNFSVPGSTFSSGSGSVGLGVGCVPDFGQVIQDAVIAGSHSSGSNTLHGNSQSLVSVKLESGDSESGQRSAGLSSPPVLSPGVQTTSFNRQVSSSTSRNNDVSNDNNISSHPIAVTLFGNSFNRSASGGGTDDEKRALEDVESNFLHSILKSYQAVFETPIPEQFSEPFIQVNGLSDIWNLTDVFIRRLIKFAKAFDEFKDLTQEDQIALLKGGVIELMSIRSVFSFDSGKNSFNIQSRGYTATTISVDIRQAQPRIPGNIFEQMSHHFEFVQQAIEFTNGDKLTLVLLMVVELFSPDRPHLKNKESVSRAQEKYSCLMRRYLEHKFGFRKAQEMFPKLLILLMKVRERGKVGSEILESCDFTSLRPLVLEMLKHSFS